MKKDDLYGFVNIKNVNRIPLEYNEAFPFVGDFAIVKKQSDYFVINKRGIKVFEENYFPLAISKLVIIVSIDCLIGSRKIFGKIPIRSTDTTRGISISFSLKSRSRISFNF